ncbi:GGDEF domain-containing protein [Alteromonadaceae bacterium BrNp21-10]|nr:GGDEF domain-containing protein [Alteromonadaceae bacterium BrNp21-10]
MVASIKQIKESFQQGGGKLNARGTLFIAINLLITSLCVYAAYAVGAGMNAYDEIDLLLEFGNASIHLFMYSFIALIPLKKKIKIFLLVGLLMTQIGTIADAIDEVIIINSVHWPRIGDTLYFIGGILVAYGAAIWVTYTYRLSTLDKLTKVHNRRFFETMVTQYLLQMQRQPQHNSMLSMDLDDFKMLNDEHGHLMGDRVLSEVGKILTDCARKGDIICRSGGEEFEMLLIGADLEQASKVGERILEQLKQNTPYGLSPLSASIGVTLVTEQDNIDSLRFRADEGMYLAKKSGKARVIEN